jgi:type I restriction enzyme S subunit
MRSEWKEVQLKEIAHFQNGYANKSNEYVSRLVDSKEVLRMGYIKRGGGFKEDEKPVFVPKTSKGCDRRYELDEGDIVIAMTDMKDRVAILGNCARIPSSNRFVLNQRVGRIRSKNEDVANQRFLYYYMNLPSHVNLLRSLANSGVQVNLTTSSIIESSISLPLIKQQKAIAHILGTLDDKIELNRKTNETLEAMAKALFKSWFVDFDPVRAKAEGRPTGLPAEISDLFPDSFEDSELGEIPSGWNLEAVGDISSNFDSKRVPVSGNDREKRKGEYPYYGATGIVDWIDDYLFDGIYLLIGEDGSVERGDGTAFSQYVSGKIWVNNHAHVLMGAKGISTEHLYLYFQFIQVAPYVTGAVQLKISQGRLNSIPVVVAPPGVNDCFSGLICHLFDRKITVGKEISTLGSLRDALLPKLISGEIRIPDAKKMLEEVGV